MEKWKLKGTPDLRARCDEYPWLLEIIKSAMEWCGDSTDSQEEYDSKVNAFIQAHTPKQLASSLIESRTISVRRSRGNDTAAVWDSLSVEEVEDILHKIHMDEIINDVGHNKMIKTDPYEKIFNVVAEPDKSGASTFNTDFNRSRAGWLSRYCADIAKELPDFIIELYDNKHRETVFKGIVREDSSLNPFLDFKVVIATDNNQLPSAHQIKPFVDNQIAEIKNPKQTMKLIEADHQCRFEKCAKFNQVISAPVGSMPKCTNCHTVLTQMTPEDHRKRARWQDMTVYTCVNATCRKFGISFGGPVTHIPLCIACGVLTSKVPIGPVSNDMLQQIKERFGK